MASEGSYLERVLIALTNNNLELLTEYHGCLNKILVSAKKCSDADLMMLLGVATRCTGI